MNNHKLKVLIIDQEQEARERLLHLLKEIPGIDKTEVVTNTDDALYKYVEFNPSIVFLDIDISQDKGYELVQLFKGKNSKCHVVITSSNKENAIKAIRHGIYDFVLKPAELDLVQDIIETYQNLMLASVETKLQKAIRAFDESPKLRISSTNSHILIDCSEILYIEADGAYSYMMLSDGKKELANTYLGKLEKILSDQRFFRISRSLIINLEKLARVNKLEGTCKLVGNDYETTVVGSKKQIKILCEMDLDKL